MCKQRANCGMRGCKRWQGEAQTLERQAAELVIYGLTPEEVTLMWRTAPPRMPGEELGR